MALVIYIILYLGWVLHATLWPPLTSYSERLPVYLSLCYLWCLSISNLANPMLRKLGSIYPRFIFASSLPASRSVHFVGLVLNVCVNVGSCWASLFTRYYSHSTFSLSLRISNALSPCTPTFPKPTTNATRWANVLWVPPIHAWNCATCDKINLTFQTRTHLSW